MLTKTIMAKDLSLEHIGLPVLFVGVYSHRSGYISTFGGELASFQLLDEGERGTALIRFVGSPEEHRTREGTVTVRYPDDYDVAEKDKRGSGFAPSEELPTEDGIYIPWQHRNALTASAIYRLVRGEWFVVGSPALNGKQARLNAEAVMANGGFVKLVTDRGVQFPQAYVEAVYSVRAQIWDQGYGACLRDGARGAFEKNSKVTRTPNPHLNWEPK